MLFNSLSFAVFLPLVFSLYWLCRDNLKAQNLLLLVASYVFYGWWDWRFLGLIAGCSLVNFLCGRQIATHAGRGGRKALLWVACVASLGTLGVFKYFNFFAENVAFAFGLVGIEVPPVILRVALPVGISFFTFQALSYTIDVYFGRLKPAGGWVEFFAFIAFFPQLVAGPIERAGNLLPQFSRPRRFDFDIAADGVCLMAFGLFKKMVVADTLSQYVDQTWKNMELYGGAACLLAALFFAIQIYCDFSGYSDFARGVARLFGFELMRNFDSPYLSASFSEFWRRWHISLSTWFRDYVYIPLGGSRVSAPLLVRNIWAVFLLSGLWHGAGWAFVAWGALHALYLTFGVIGRKIFPRPAETAHSGVFPRLASVLAVDAGVVFAWIFFRAGSIGGAFAFLKTMLTPGWNMSLMAWCAGLGPVKFAFCLIVCALFLACAFCPRDCKFASTRSKFSFSVLCCAAIVFLGMPSGGEFIYFKF